MRAPRGSGRLLAAVAAAAAAVVVGAPAPAQAPALPVIQMGTPIAPRVQSYVDCDGDRHLVTVVDGFAVVNRDDIGATDPAPVDVGVAFTGDLADDLVDPVASISVSSEGRYSAIPFVLPPDAAGTLTITLEPGAGYTVGDPGAGTVTVSGEPSLEAADCTEPLALPAGVADQTIAVGGRPVDLPEPGDEEGYDIVGALPPGLTFDRGRWSGAATTPGTYVLDVRLCGVPVVPGPITGVAVCTASADVTIVVEGASGPSTPAAPATPVTGAARLTG